VAELRPHGLEAVAVSLDSTPDAAREWVEAANLSFPAVVDIHHRTAELYGVINIPSTVWFGKDGDMVRPPTIAPGDDRFRQFTGVDASVHHDALRRWVVDGEEPDRTLMQRWSQPEAQDASAARAHRRVAAFLHRSGRDDLAREHFETAVRLAPFDWTIRRGSMSMTGGDPFGSELFEFWEQWEAACKPGYGQ
jgi:hypothetical protein